MAELIINAKYDEALDTTTMKGDIDLVLDTVKSAIERYNALDNIKIVVTLQD